jgi:ABC-2 type transport system permease protein
MRAITTVYLKEIRAYLVSPIPYIVLALVTGYLSMHFFWREKPGFFLLKQASLADLFEQIPVAFIVLVPALTMRLWSEEVRSGTVETLLTMPVKPVSLVIGKHLAAWTVLLVCILGTLTVFFTVNGLGDVDAGVVWTGYLGALLMGGALLALGMWISSLTRHQIVAFLLTLVAGILLHFLAEAAHAAGPGLGSLFEDLSTQSRYASLGRGVVDFRDALYFVSVMVFFLYLNSESVENRRYR